MLKICDTDTIKVRKWQNELLSYRAENGKPFAQTYLKTVNNQLSAGMNYVVALTPADILPSKRVDINKNYAKIKGGRAVFGTEDAQGKAVYFPPRLPV